MRDQSSNPTTLDHRAQSRATYDGTRGALLTAASALSGNLASAERLFKRRVFDLRGLTTILDVGSGAGQLTVPLLKYADAGTQVTCSDLSQNMLRRARNRMRERRPDYACGDIERLPFRDESFDGVVCGFVLEHLPDPAVGLVELLRVLRPGGRLMLLIMIDSLLSKVTAKLWHCRTCDPQRLIAEGLQQGADLQEDVRLAGWQRLVRGEGRALVFQKR